jgi:hypothetical protein
VCRCIKSTSLSTASEDFGISHICHLWHTQIEYNCGHETCGLVLGHYQNLLIDGIIIQLHNELLYYHQPCHCPTCVEPLGIDCEVQDANANEAITSKSRNIWVQYTESDLHATFQCRGPSFPVIYCSWTPQNLIPELQERLPGGKSVLTSSKRWEKTVQ